MRRRKCFSSWKVFYIKNTYVIYFIRTIYYKNWKNRFFNTFAQFFFISYRCCCRKKTSTAIHKFDFSYLASRRRHGHSFFFFLLQSLCIERVMSRVPLFLFNTGGLHGMRWVLTQQYIRNCLNIDVSKIDEKREKSYLPFTKTENEKASTLGIFCVLLAWNKTIIIIIITRGPCSILAKARQSPS